MIAVLKAPEIEFNDLDEVEEASNRRYSLRGNQRRKMTNADIIAEQEAKKLEEMLSQAKNDKGLDDKDKGKEEDKGGDDKLPNSAGSRKSLSSRERKEEKLSEPHLPPVFLTVPVHEVETEARPPMVEPERRRKSLHRLKLPKVDE